MCVMLCVCSSSPEKPVQAQRPEHGEGVFSREEEVLPVLGSDRWEGGGSVWVW